MSIYCALGASEPNMLYAVYVLDDPTVFVGNALFFCCVAIVLFVLIFDRDWGMAPRQGGGLSAFFSQ